MLRRAAAGIASHCNSKHVTSLSTWCRVSQHRRNQSSKTSSRSILPATVMSSSSDCLSGSLLPVCVQSSGRLHYSTNTPEKPADEDIPIWTEQDYQRIGEDKYILPQGGQQVLILQPDIKWGPRKPQLTTAELQLEEACALIETLPEWRVVNTMIRSLKQPNKKFIFGSGSFQEITRIIRGTPGITAVFFNVSMLTATQLGAMQRAWKLPVYDRYTIVLQIFKIHARTRETKLQVALAELPYFRSRLQGMHDGTLDQQQGGMSHIGGSGETFLEIRKRLLQEKEMKIKEALADLKSQREILRKNRVVKEYPVVAVVGYTNAGKTSLIKALTHSDSMEPRDQLFATLDVTTHAGLLPNKTKLLYVDTVGFISDIPTDLIESFASTLEDATAADVIIHVRDISHPDAEAQKAHVLRTLDELHISESQKQNMIEVCNKVDKVKDQSILQSEEGHLVSVHKLQGMGDLLEAVQEAVIAATGRIKKTLRIPLGGPHLQWLYKEADVVGTREDTKSTELLLVEVIFTKASFAKFKSTFMHKR